MTSPEKLSSAIDNNARALLRVLEALARANALPWTPAYGADPVTERAVRSIEALFSRPGRPAHAKLVGSGTIANVLACASFLKPWQAVVTPASSHAHVDECGALERLSGCKLMTVPTADGKLSPELLEPSAAWVGDVHHPQARVISISQPTELGTLYSAKELQALADWAHARGMILHVDGARFANAVAALGCHASNITTDVGVDVLSLGGTKNGLLGAEAVVFFGHPDEAAAFEFLRKQAGQLFSKMRFVAAQFEAYLEKDLWLENARHANAMAKRLSEGAQGKIPFAHSPQTNAVFVRLSKAQADRLLERFYFYPWQMDADGQAGIYRWMTSFQTTPEQVDALLRSIAHS